MPNPIKYTDADKESEGAQKIDVSSVMAFRFGNKDKYDDWVSPTRSKNTKWSKGMPTADNTSYACSENQLNDQALHQIHFGRKSSGVNLMISLATNHERLSKSSEGWVRDILNQAPHMGIFKIPYDCLLRPDKGVTELQRSETEWLYCDAQILLLDHLMRWEVNPYKK